MAASESQRRRLWTGMLDCDLPLVYRRTRGGSGRGGFGGRRLGFGGPGGRGFGREGLGWLGGRGERRDLRKGDLRRAIHCLLVSRKQRASPTRRFAPVGPDRPILVLVRDHCQLLRLGNHLLWTLNSQVLPAAFLDRPQQRRIR